MASIVSSNFFLFFFNQRRVEILTNLRGRFVSRTFVANIGERET